MAAPTETPQQELLVATQRLISAGTRQDVADIAVAVAVDVLEMAYIGIHLYEESQGALIPIAWSDSIEKMIDEPPTLGEQSLAWEVYQENTLQTFEDLQSVDSAHNSHTPFQSETIVPLGEHGVLLISSPHTSSIDETRRRLAKILGANVTAALDRIALEETLSSFEQAIEQSGHAIFITERDGTITYVNPAFEDMTGYPAEEAIGRNPRILRSGEHEQAFYQALWETILSGEVWSEEVVNEDKNGERFSVDQTIAPITNADGKISQFVAVNNDITELKQRERNLELLNQFVRHDIRNQLQPILAYADALQTEGESDNDDYVEQILETVHNAIEITTTARDVTEIMLYSDKELQPVQLATVLKDEIEDIRMKYDSAVIEVEGELPAVSVRADDMLSSIFRNLLTNAIQHNDKEAPGATVSVATDDRTVVVQVADNGPGISDYRKKEIFTQEKMGLDSDGTGIGLYLVDTLVKRYGGEVRVEDNEPEGTVFSVELSIVDAD